MRINDDVSTNDRRRHAHSRRMALRGLGAGLLVVGAGLGPSRSGTAAQEEAAPPAPALFAGETFAGTTSDPTTLVAVVLAAPDAAERAARAYLCDGAEIDAWLLGTLTGDTLELQAEAGARLEGQRTAAGVTGAVTLPDGTSLTFEAVPAVGVGGLYTVAVSPAFTWGGPSAAGARCGAWSRRGRWRPGRSGNTTTTWWSASSPHPRGSRCRCS